MRSTNRAQSKCQDHDYNNDKRHKKLRTAEMNCKGGYRVEKADNLTKLSHRDGR